jgi:hypothetical protein
VLLKNKGFMYIENLVRLRIGNFEVGLPQYKAEKCNDPIVAGFVKQSLNVRTWQRKSK